MFEIIVYFEKIKDVEICSKLDVEMIGNCLRCINFVY